MKGMIYLHLAICQFIFVRKYEELSKVAEETKKNFAAYERDDLKLREVSSSLNPYHLPRKFASVRSM